MLVDPNVDLFNFKCHYEERSDKAISLTQRKKGLEIRDERFL